MTATAPTTRSWREVYPPHPAAEVFPMMSDAELDALAEDINEHGVLVNPILWQDADGQVWLLDGRNRMEGAERAGVPVDLGDMDQSWVVEDGTDPLAFVVSMNAHRRHLTREQKRDAIASMLVLDPSRPDLQVAKDLGVSPRTVGKVRAGLEESGDVSKLETRTDTNGRRQPARKAKPTPPADDAPPDTPIGAQVYATRGAVKAIPRLGPMPPDTPDTVVAVLREAITDLESLRRHYRRRIDQMHEAKTQDGQTSLDDDGSLL